MKDILLSILGAGAVAFLLWWLDSRSANRRQAQAQMAEENRLSEVSVAKVQAAFEERLRIAVTSSLPDAVTRRPLYIYQSLMRPWFGKLSAKYRYDDPVVRKVRQDWLSYMELLQSKETCSFLGAEADGDDVKDRYGREEREDLLRLTAIEDAFAAAAGPEAVEVLGQMRAKEYDAFSVEGELAPDGYRWRIYYPPNVPREPVPR